jgi:3D (Asp-Asp-Asp) domain-containing protein
VFVVPVALLLVTAAEAYTKPRHPPALRMTATAYCDRGKTKAGVHVREGIVAADPRRLPLGSRVRIVAPGRAHAGTYVVADTGSEIKGRDLDIFMPSCRAAKTFGKKIVSVQVLKRGDGAKDAREEVQKRIGR